MRKLVKYASYAESRTCRINSRPLKSLLRSIDDFDRQTLGMGHIDHKLYKRGLFSQGLDLLTTQQRETL